MKSSVSKARRAAPSSGPALRGSLLEALREIPLIDVHSHLDDEKVYEGTLLQDLLFYHMLQYELRSAGMEGFDRWGLMDKSEDEVRKIVFAAWERAGDGVANTGFAWILRGILKDLYGYEGPLKGKGLAKIDSLLAERRRDASWYPSVFKKAGIKKILSSACARHKPVPKDNPLKGVLVPTAECFPCGVIGEDVFYLFDSLRHMERRKLKFKFEVESLKDYKALLRRLNGKFNKPAKRVAIQWISGLTDFSPMPERKADALLKKFLKGAHSTPKEAGQLQGVFVRALLEELGSTAKVFQICYGSQYMKDHGTYPLQRAVPRFAGTIGTLIEERPDLHFNMLNGFEADEPALASLCVAYPNVSLGGYWWHTFYQSVMHNAWQRRLDVVPATNLMGFFSDGYCAEWIYGRALMTRRVMANMLAERIERGFCSFDEALAIARTTLWDAPCRIMLGGVPEEA